MISCADYHLLLQGYIVESFGQPKIPLMQLVVLLIRKYDDLGDWLYFKLMINNAGTLIKAALGNTEEYDKLLP